MADFILTARFSDEKIANLVKMYRKKLKNSNLSLDPGRQDLNKWIKNSGDVIVNYGVCKQKTMTQYDSAQVFLENVKKYHNLCSIHKTPYINLDKGFYLTKIIYPHFKFFFPEGENGTIVLALVPKQHTLSAISYYMFNKDISVDYKEQFFEQYIYERSCCAVIPLCIGREKQLVGLETIARQLGLESCFINNFELINRNTIVASKDAIFLKKLTLFIPRPHHPNQLQLQTTEDPLAQISWIRNSHSRSRSHNGSKSNGSKNSSSSSSSSSSKDGKEDDNIAKNDGSGSDAKRRKYFFYLNGKDLLDLRCSLGTSCMMYLLNQVPAIWTSKVTLMSMDHITLFVAYMTQRGLELVKEKLSSFFAETKTQILELTVSTKFHKNFSNNLLVFPLNETQTLKILKELREKCVLHLQEAISSNDFQLADKRFSPHLTFARSEKNNNVLIQSWNASTDANVGNGSRTIRLSSMINVEVV